MAGCLPESRGILVTMDINDIKQIQSDDIYISIIRFLIFRSGRWGLFRAESSRGGLCNHACVTLYLLILLLHWLIN